MVFGQVVIGPPGSGKTTYCNGMSQFLQLIGRYELLFGVQHRKALIELILCSGHLS